MTRSGRTGVVTLDDQTRSDAARHVENPTPGCECHGDTYCEWCGDEWPCTVRRLLDALEPEGRES